MIKKNINMYLFLMFNAYIYLFSFRGFTKISNKSTIIAFIIGSILSYIILNIFFNIKKNKTLTIKNTTLITRIILGIMISIILQFALRKQVTFINYNIIDTVNIYLIIISISLTGIYIAHKGFLTIIKSSYIFFYLFIFIFIITIIFSFSKIDINNLLNVTDSSKQNVIISIINYFILSLSPYISLYFMDYHLDQKNIITLKKGFILNNIFMLIWLIIILGILGINLCNLYEYPEVFILKKISFLNIIERMETVFSSIIFLSMFVLFSSFISHFVSLFNIKKKEWLFLSLGIILILSYNIININLLLFMISLVLLFIVVNIINVN